MLQGSTYSPDPDSAREEIVPLDDPFAYTPLVFAASEVSTHSI